MRCIKGKISFPYLFVRLGKNNWVNTGLTIVFGSFVIIKFAGGLRALILFPDNGNNGMIMIKTTKGISEAVNFLCLPLKVLVKSGSH